MKKICLLLLIIHGLISASFCQNSNGPVSVQGSVKGKWLASNTYRVEEIITINASDTLVIEPGTLIEFSSNTYLEIKGLLIAQGLVQKPIIFKGIDGSNSIWGGLRFEQSARMPIIESCNFENFGAYDSRNSGALYFNNHKIPNIIRCEFRDGYNRAIVVENFGIIQSLNISYCSFTNVTGFSIVLVSGKILDPLNITNNRFIGQTDTTCLGISIRHVVCPQINSIGNYFKNLHDGTEADNTEPGIVFCLEGPNSIGKFYSESDTISKCSSDHYPLSTIKVKDQLTFTKAVIDSSSGEFGLFRLAGSGFILKDCFIERNTTGRSGGCFDFNPVNKNGDIKILGSTIRNNKSEYRAGVLNILSEEKTIGNLVINQNTLQGNYGISGGVVFVKIAGANQISITENYEIGGNSAQQGGFLFCQSSGNVNQVFIDKNVATATLLSSEGNGGMISLECKRIELLSLTENNFNNLQSTGMGGLMYCSSEATSKIEFNDNIFNGQINAGSDGGLLAVSTTSINEISCKDNHFDIELDVGGSGGVLSIQAPLAQIVKLELSGNVGNINSKVAGSGGFLCLEASSINEAKVIGNGGEFNFTTGQDGGFIKLSTSKFLTSLNYGNNTFGVNESSNGDGGSIHLTAPIMNKLNIYENKCLGDVQSLNGSGGFLYCKANFGRDGSIQISNNTFADLNCATDGGGFYISGHLPNTINFSSNQITGNSIAGNSGGLFFISNNQYRSSIDFSFSNNTVEQNCQSGLDGGVLFWSGRGLHNLDVLDNNISKCKSDHEGGAFYIFATDTINKFVCSNNRTETSQSKGQGGWLSLRANALKYLDISGNTVGQSDAGGNGGLISVHAGLPNGFTFQRNKIDNSSSEDQGGLAYFSGIIGQSIIIKLNSIDQSESQDNGGTFSIDNQNPEPTGLLLLTDNQVLSSTSVSGQGGYLYYSGRGINHVSINNNRFNNCFAPKGDGGAFTIDCPDRLGLIEISENQIANFSCQNEGGFANIFSKEVRSAIIKNNYVTGSSQKSLNAKDGGFVSFEKLLKIDSLVVDKNQFNSIDISGKGGILAFSKPFISKYFYIGNNIFDDIHSKGDGGVIYMTTRLLDEITLENNHFQSCVTDRRGGVLYHSGLIGKMDIRRDTALNCFAKDAGGFLYDSITSPFSAKIKLEEIAVTFSPDNQGRANDLSRAQGLFISGVSDVTIKNAKFDYLSAIDSTGGVLISGADRVSISSSLFTNCWTTGNGSGLGLYQNKVALVTNCLFEANYSGRGSLYSYADSPNDSLTIMKSVFNSNQAGRDGGGLALRGGIAYLEDVEILHCQAGVSPNNYLLEGNGGGIYSINTRLNLSQCKISQNSASVSGGGIYASGKTDPQAKIGINLSYINNNTADYGGGGVCFELIRADLNLTHIGYNRATDSSFSKGGGSLIAYNNEKTTLTNCLVYGNSCQSNNAAAGIHLISLRDPNPPEKEVLDLINTTIYNHNNYSIFCDDDNNDLIVRAFNTIIWGSNGANSRAPQINDQAEEYYFQNSCVQNLPAWAIGNGNIYLYPQFENSSFLLRDSSSCIDAGIKGEQWMDSIFPPGKRLHRNDIGATGGPHNTVDISFFNLTSFERLDPTFRVLDIDCEGIAKIEILDYRPEEFSYQFLVDNHMVDSGIESQRFLPLIQGKWHLIKMVSYKGNEVLDADIREVYVQGPFDRISPEINNHHSIENNGNFFMPCSSGTCSFDFVFDIIQTIFPPFTNEDWIIQHPGDISFLYKDSQHVRFRLTMDEFSANDSIRIGYRISNTCYEKVTWFSFKIEPRQRFSSGISNLDLESIHIFPNPFIDKVYITVDGNFGDSIIVDVCNGLGSKLSSTQFDQIDENGISLDLKHLPSGIYYLVVKSESYRKSIRIMKL